MTKKPEAKKAEEKVEDKIEEQPAAEEKAEEANDSPVEEGKPEEAPAVDNANVEAGATPFEGKPLLHRLQHLEKDFLKEVNKYAKGLTAAEARKLLTWVSNQIENG